MESHPTYKDLKSLCEKYPKQAGSLFQTYNDLLLSQQWEDVKAIEVPVAQRVAIYGRKASTDPLRLVVPCSLGESLSLSWVNTVFDKISPTPAEIYLGITSTDSSIVYYKLSKGIVKPPI